MKFCLLEETEKRTSYGGSSSWVQEQLMEYEFLETFIRDQPLVAHWSNLTSDIHNRLNIWSQHLLRVLPMWPLDNLERRAAPSILELGWGLLTHLISCKRLSWLCNYWCRFLLDWRRQVLNITKVTQTGISQQLRMQALLAAFTGLQIRIQSAILVHTWVHDRINIILWVFHFILFEI